MELAKVFYVAQFSTYLKAPPKHLPLVYTTVEKALPPTYMYKVHETGLAKSFVHENDSRKSQTQSKHYCINVAGVDSNKKCWVEPRNAQL